MVVYHMEGGHHTVVRLDYHVVYEIFSYTVHFSHLYRHLMLTRLALI